MATSGVMADFARLPAQRKVLIFVVAALLLAGLYYQFVFKGLKDDTDQAEAENAAKANTDRQLGADIPKYEELKGQVKKLQEKITSNQKALPTQAEVPAFFEMLERKITESGVSIEKWRKLNEEPVDNFVRVPVEIEMVGTFMQIKRFFATLAQHGMATKSGDDAHPEDLERIISIENLSLTNPVVKNREIVLTARFVAVTFRQEDKAATDALNSKPVSPNKQAPLPPSTTPAGAKARVEQSLKKGAAQNANAAGVDEAKTPSGNGSAALKGGM
ncbi:MAG TPA: type 4a pilus biogenesis protein PilO [Kofleriaceae bacterium]|jgi:Tfp pilus assembly protein PilO